MKPVKKIEGPGADTLAQPFETCCVVARLSFHSYREEVSLATLRYWHDTYIVHWPLVPPETCMSIVCGPEK
jgi:hypothetical protein